MNFSRVDWVPLMAIAGGGVVGAFAFGSLSMHTHADVVVVHEVTAEAHDAVDGGKVYWSPDGRRVTWAPTEPPATRIRISGSVISAADPEPLIYVDGIRVGGRDYLDNLDPSAIDRIEVIKGDAATALFGQDAAGGVIQIFLKEVLDADAARRRRDLALLLEALDGASNRPVRIAALEGIPAAAASSELQHILDELVEARVELRVLRDRYADDYPPIQDLLEEIQTIETRVIPQVLRGIVTELVIRQAREDGSDGR